MGPITVSASEACDEGPRSWHRAWLQSQKRSKPRTLAGEPQRRGELGALGWACPAAQVLPASVGTAPRAWAAAWGPAQRDHLRALLSSRRGQGVEGRAGSSPPAAGRGLGAGAALCAVCERSGSRALSRAGQKGSQPPPAPDPQRSLKLPARPPPAPAPLWTLLPFR